MRIPLHDQEILSKIKQTGAGVESSQYLCVSACWVCVSSGWRSGCVCVYTLISICKVGEIERVRKREWKNWDIHCEMASKEEKNPWYVDNKQGWLTNRLRVSLFYRFRHSWIILRFSCLLIQLPWNWKAQRIFTMILPNSWIVIAWLKLLIPAFFERIVPVLWSDLTFHFTRNEGHTSEAWSWWNSPSAIGHMAVSGVMFLLHVKVRCSQDWQAGWAGSPFRDLFVCLLVCSTPPPCLLSAYPCVRRELVHRWEGYRERKKEKQRKRARDIEKQGRKGMTNKERVHVKGRKETPPVQTQKKNESKRQAGGRPAPRLTSYLTRRVDRCTVALHPPFWQRTSFLHFMHQRTTSISTSRLIVHG